MARTTFGVVFVALLGCTGLFGPPTIARFDVEGRECGDWTAEISVENLRGQEVLLVRDGEVLRTFPSSWGDQVWTVDDGAPLTATTPFELRIDGTPVRAMQVVALEGPVVNAELRPSPTAFAPGIAPRFDLWVHASCEVPGLQWRGSTDSWSGDGPITGPVTSVVLPEHADGPHVLRLDVVDAQGPVGQAEARFAVGTNDDLDVDGDGHPGASDCDDHDPSVFPDAPEKSAPNGIDDNCDGRTDEGTIAYDDDGDGLTEQAGDCNDRDAQTLPGATERPNCRDDDCDQTVDEGTTLPHDDDGYEHPDGVAYRWDGIGRRFETEVRIVSRDRTDREAFQFWSDDGGWDSWGIDVVGVRIPANSVYQVEIRRVDGGTMATGELSADGQVVGVTGAAFRDDSAFYEVVLRPVSLYADWCPAEFTLLSR